MSDVPGIDVAAVTAWLEAHVAGADRPVRVRRDRRRPLEPHVPGHRRRRHAATCCAARRSATCWRAPTTWAASTASSPACRRTAVPVRAGARVLRRPRRQRRTVLRDGLRRRPRRSATAPPPRRALTPTAAGARASRVASSTRWPRSTPSTSTPSGSPTSARHEGYIARQLKRWYGQWNQQKTAELAAVDRVHDGLLAAHPRAGPGHASSTATTASTTAWSTTTATSSPCSTGRSARSATRSPTSACCRCTGPGPTTTPTAWTGTSTTAPGFCDRAAARRALRRGHRARHLAARLLRRVRVLEAGLHPRGRLRPLPRRRARRSRPEELAPFKLQVEHAAADAPSATWTHCRERRRYDGTRVRVARRRPMLARADPRRDADRVDRCRRRCGRGDRRHCRGECETQPARATFDGDTFIDYRARRPIDGAPRRRQHRPRLARRSS